MNSAGTEFGSEAGTPELKPDKKRRGVRVITQYGRGISFGISRERTERMLRLIALRKKYQSIAALPEKNAPACKKP